MMRSVGFALTLAAALGSAAAARAECRASESGTWSMSKRLSPRSGILCLTDVSVWEGASCGPGAPRWVATFGCGETLHMVVTDRGSLVSLLMARASRRSWEIVRIFERDADGLAVRSVRFGELPGVPERARRARLRLDPRTLRIVIGRTTIEAPVASLLGLGRVSSRRPRRGI